MQVLVFNHAYISFVLEHATLADLVSVLSLYVFAILRVLYHGSKLKTCSPIIVIGSYKVFMY